MRVLKANSQADRGILYYITFKAKTHGSDAIMMFQDHVLDGIWSTEVDLVRIYPAN